MSYSNHPTPDLPNTGFHTARLIEIMDLGFQKRFANGGEYTQHELCLGFEVDQLNRYNNRHIIRTRLKNSFDVNSPLRKLLEQWAGQLFNDTDQIKLGHYFCHLATVEVAHYHHQKSNLDKAKIVGVYPVAEGQAMSHTRNTTILLSLDQYNHEEFLKMPAYWRSLTAKSPQFQAAQKAYFASLRTGRQSLSATADNQASSLERGHAG